MIVVREDSNPDDVPAFHPDMCHQIFGENETIFGYKDLKIRLYYSAGSLDIFFDINYSESVRDFTFKISFILIY